MLWFFRIFIDFSCNLQNCMFLCSGKFYFSWICGSMKIYKISVDIKYFWRKSRSLFFWLIFLWFFQIEPKLSFPMFVPCSMCMYSRRSVNQDRIAVNSHKHKSSTVDGMEIGKRMYENTSYLVFWIQLFGCFSQYCLNKIRFIKKILSGVPFHQYGRIYLLSFQKKINKWWRYRILWKNFCTFLSEKR